MLCGVPSGSLYPSEGPSDHSGRRARGKGKEEEELEEEEWGDEDEGKGQQYERGTIKGEKSL